MSIVLIEKLLGMDIKRAYIAMIYALWLRIDNCRLLGLLDSNFHSVGTLTDNV